MSSPLSLMLREIHLEMTLWKILKENKHSLLLHRKKILPYLLQVGDGNACGEPFVEGQ